MIGITMGDAAGIGSEIIIKALRHFDTDRFAIYGSAACLEKAFSFTGAPTPEINILDKRMDARPCALNVVDLGAIDPSAFEMGRENAECGKASYLYIERALKDAGKGIISCVCTAPINKVSLRMAAVPYIGHTEIFASLTGTEDPLTMFQVDKLRIFFLSRHVALREACALVTVERLMDYIPRCIEALKQLGLQGTLAVAGLNPHSGEHGLFGDEDGQVEKAVSLCQKRGLDVVGPIGADSVFHQCLMGRYAAVLSLYHDQGHIAAKTYDFNRTISLTLGMPVLRFSVDHGTAFDIAGRGVADETGMVSCLSAALSWENTKLNL